MWREVGKLLLSVADVFVLLLPCLAAVIIPELINVPCAYRHLTRGFEFVFEVGVLHRSIHFTLPQNKLLSILRLLSSGCFPHVTLKSGRCHFSVSCVSFCLQVTWSDSSISCIHRSFNDLVNLHNKVGWTKGETPISHTASESPSSCFCFSSRVSA